MREDNYFQNEGIRSKDILMFSPNLKSKRTIYTDKIIVSAHIIKSILGLDFINLTENQINGLFFIVIYPFYYRV